MMKTVILATLLATINNAWSQGLVEDIWDKSKVNVVKDGKLLRAGDGKVLSLVKPVPTFEDDNVMILERNLTALKPKKINVIDDEDFQYQLDYLTEDVEYLKKRCKKTPEKCVQRIKRTLFTEGEGAGKNLIALELGKNFLAYPEIGSSGEVSFKYDLKGSTWEWLIEKDNTLDPTTTKVSRAASNGPLQIAYAEVVNYGDLDSGVLMLNALHASDLVANRLSEVSVEEQVKRFEYKSSLDHNLVLKNVLVLSSINEASAFEQLKAYRNGFEKLLVLEKNGSVFELLIEAINRNLNVENLGKDIISESMASDGFQELKPLKISTKAKIGELK